MAFDQEKLDRLRSRYADGTGGDMHNEEFSRIADMIFSANGRRPPPYAGIPSLLDAPVRQLDMDNPDLTDIEVALFGVPMDLGVTNRNGSRFGPRALRSIERVGPYNDALHCAPVHEMKVVDIGDVPMDSRFDLTRSHSCLLYTSPSPRDS